MQFVLINFLQKQIKYMLEIIQEQLQTNQFFKGGFILSIMAGVGIYLKSLVPIIRDWIMRQISFSTTVESKTELYNIFNEWLYKNHNNKYRKVLSSCTYAEPRSSNKPLEDEHVEEQDLIYYKESNFNSSFNIFFRGYLIRVEASREKFESTYDQSSAHIDSYTITSYFSKKAVRILLEDLLENYNNDRKVKKLNKLYDFMNHNGWRNQGIIRTKPYDKIFNNEKEELLVDIENFIGNKKYYSDRGIPYRRGYLLHGLPGNGKTSAILAIANKLKKDVYNLNLSSIDNDMYLKEAFSYLPENCFLLIEDVDASLNGREKINKINFNTLLNVLDGSLAKENICVFFTTNHLDKLDSALIRCGRVDKKIEFKNPTKENVKSMMSLFYENVEKTDFQYLENKHASEIQEILITEKNLKEVIVKLTDFP